VNGARQRIGARALAAGLMLVSTQVFPAGPATAGVDLQGPYVVSWGSVEVEATPALTFEVLTDYDRMAAFLPGMLASRVISRDANTAVVEQTADEGMLFFSQRVTARLAVEELPPLRLTVKALSGSFKELTGNYVLTRRPGGTLIEYSARFIPDFHLPRVVGKFAVQQSLERHLDGLAAEIRRRAKGDSTTNRPTVPPGVPPGRNSPPVRASPPSVPGG
jgi:ribosome-associated toxin RatA of RatAB toxin-antitoxin module